MECSLVETFHWPLSQIDETDLESLINFIIYFNWRSKHAGRWQIGAEQAAWLN